MIQAVALYLYLILDIVVMASFLQKGDWAMSVAWFGYAIATTGFIMYGAR